MGLFILETATLHSPTARAGRPRGRNLRGRFPNDSGVGAVSSSDARTGSSDSAAGRLPPEAGPFLEPDG